MRPARIGALRHRLTLEAPLRVAGEGGTAVLQWTALATVWAEIVAVSGGEVAAGDGTRGAVTHEVRLRWRDGVLPAMRFVADAGRILEIRSVRDPGGRRRWLVCACEERLP